MPKHPHITVELIGHDGNAFVILGRVQQALRKGGVAEEQIDAFMKEATKADYDHLLRVVQEWVTVE